VDWIDDLESFAGGGAWNFTWNSIDASAWLGGHARHACHFGDSIDLDSRSNISSGLGGRDAHPGVDSPG